MNLYLFYRVLSWKNKKYVGKSNKKIKLIPVSVEFQKNHQQIKGCFILFYKIK